MSCINRLNFHELCEDDRVVLSNGLVAQFKEYDFDNIDGYPVKVMLGSNGKEYFFNPISGECSTSDIPKIIGLLNFNHAKTLVPSGETPANASQKHCEGVYAPRFITRSGKVLSLVKYFHDGELAPGVEYMNVEDSDDNKYFYHACGQPYENPLPNLDDYNRRDISEDIIYYFDTQSRVKPFIRRIDIREMVIGL